MSAPDTRTVALVGAPTDVGAGVRGMAMGPEALRVAGLAGVLEDAGRTVVDAGDLHGPGNPGHPTVGGYRHLREVTQWNGLVHDAVLHELQADRLPVLLGGDHCVAVGSIAAVARHCRVTGRRLRVLWLDAHADFNTAASTPTGNLHGMPVATLCGDGPMELTRLGASLPAIGVDVVKQIGVRSVDAAERDRIAAARLEVFDMRAIDTLGMAAVMDRALAGLDADTHLHVSFDVDFLDPSIAPGVGTAVPGGPTFREARLCMERIAETGLLASLDIVEVNPALDHRNRTAEVAVALMASLFERRVGGPRLPAFTIRGESVPA